MNQRKGRKPMNQRKGGKKYVCGAGIGIISLIAFYAVLSGTENKRILQVKNEIYTFEMTEEEAAKAVFDYIYSDCDYDYDAKDCDYRKSVCNRFGAVVQQTNEC